MHAHAPPEGDRFTRMHTPPEGVIVTRMHTPSESATDTRVPAIAPLRTTRTRVPAIASLTARVPRVPCKNVSLFAHVYPVFPMYLCTLCNLCTRDRAYVREKGRARGGAEEAPCTVCVRHTPFACPRSALARRQACD